MGSENTSNNSNSINSEGEKYNSNQKYEENYKSYSKYEGNYKSYSKFEEEKQQRLKTEEINKISKLTEREKIGESKIEDKGEQIKLSDFLIPRKKEKKLRRKN